MTFKSADDQAIRPPPDGMRRDDIGRDGSLTGDCTYGLARRRLVALVLSDFFGFRGSCRALAQAHGFERLPALDGFGNSRAGARDKSLAVLGVANIALGTELGGLELQIRALELWVLFRTLRCAGRSVAKGSRCSGTLRQKIAPFNNPPVAMCGDLVLVGLSTRALRHRVEAR